MQTSLALFALIVALGSAANVYDRTFYESKYFEWQESTGKRSWVAAHSSSGAEHVKRLGVFADNHDMIEAHNAAGHSYKMGHNEFSDRTWEEFKGMMMSEPMPKKESNPVKTFLRLGALADSVDWTTQNAVTPVKNQGQCGSCWAFSTTGGLEGAYAIKNSDLKSFSEQQLVDCDKVDSGCSGGLMDNAFKWIQGNGGICLEDDYQYTAADGQCQTSCSVVDGTAPSKWTDVGQSEDQLKAAVAQQPVSIAIEADQSGFQFYSNGVFTGACGTNLDHGVLAVGYGSDNGQDYWKVKNSWGATWGEQGYMMMERGASQQGGQCGILMSASYPTL